MPVCNYGWLPLALDGRVVTKIPLHKIHMCMLCKIKVLSAHTYSGVYAPITQILAYPSRLVEIERKTATKMTCFQFHVEDNQKHCHDLLSIAVFVFL